MLGLNYNETSKQEGIDFECLSDGRGQAGVWNIHIGNKTISVLISAGNNPIYK